MRILKYYINILHFVIYKFCNKYHKALPDFPVDVNSGRIIMLLSLLPAMQFFIFYLKYCKIRNYQFKPEIVFLFIIPFALLVWFSVIYKDKYLIYFKQFEKESKVVKQKWAWISFGIVVGIILLLIASYWMLMYQS